MKLPHQWQRNHSSELTYWLDNNMLSDEDTDRVLTELDARQRQHDANRGAMNGLAPEM